MAAGDFEGNRKVLKVMDVGETELKKKTELNKKTVLFLNPFNLKQITQLNLFLHKLLIFRLITTHAIAFVHVIYLFLVFNRDLFAES